MKLRIQDGHVRIRLSMAELEQLCKGNTVKMRTPIGPGVLTTLVHSYGEVSEVRLDDNTLHISFPMRRFVDLKKSQEEGFYHRFENDSNQSIQLAIEKDFKCIGREEPLNEGLFPNPKAKKGEC